MAASSSVPVDVASQPTLVHALTAARGLRPGLPALLDKDENGAYSRQTSLAAFVDTAQSLGESLAAMGLEELDRVAIWAENSPEWNLADVATAMNRAATVGLYINDSLDDLAYKIRDSGARFVFADSPERLSALKSIPTTEIPEVDEIIVFQSGLRDLVDDGNVHRFSKVLADPGTNIGDRIEGLRPEDKAKIMYTSGTTSRPKGAIVTHESLLANVVGFTPFTAIQPESVVISYLPNAHIFQALLDYTAWLNGCCLGYSHKTTLKADLPRLRPHFFPGVPKVFKMLLQAMAQLLASLSSGKASLFEDSFSQEEWADTLKQTVGLDRAAYCLSGAARLDDRTIRLYEEKLGLAVDQGYGISEVSGGVSIGGPMGRRLGRCGRPLPGLELVVVDEGRTPLAPGERGQIAVKGPMVFAGYINQPEATREVLADGWYYTGDRGILDEDGFLEVLGRMGHRVKFANGEYYDLEAIGENYLRQASLIGQIVVAGEYRDYAVALLALSDDLLAAQAVARKSDIDFEEARDLVYHDRIIDLVRDEFERIKDRGELGHPLERIQKALYLRPFNADNQEATPTQKTRIAFVIERYKEEITSLYDSDESFRVLRV